MTLKAEALIYAEELEEYGEFQTYFDGVAAELRRQHDEIKRLHEEQQHLQKQLDGLVTALMWIKGRCPEYLFFVGQADNRHYEAAFDVRSCAKAALKRVEQE